MLHLHSATRDSFIPEALAALDTILLDHAHCEKKAASTALGFIYRYSQYPEIVVPLSRLAREELAHFEEVIRHLDRRGVAFRRLPPSGYAAALHEAVRPQEPARMIDTFLVAALIEARSCERMALLATALEQVDPALARLYDGLLESEARHHATYLDLLEQAGVATREEIRARLAELARHEAAVLEVTRDEPRLHH